MDLHMDKSLTASLSWPGLLFRVLAVAFVVYALLVGIVFFVADGNDYAESSLDKHARLRQLKGPKVVVVGGSNVAFGIDSPLLEQLVGRPVVNMGMNGFFGARFMLEEIKPALNEGDIVVASFEPDGYFGIGDGESSVHVMIAKTRPVSLNYLTPSQVWAVAEKVPYAAHKKVMRIMGQIVRGMRTMAQGEVVDPVTVESVIQKIETRDGFNAHGDLVSHLGVEWPFEVADGFDLTKRGVDTKVLDVLERFVDEMRARGVKVVVSHAPVEREFYEKHRSAFEDFAARLEARGLPAPLLPERFVFPKDFFFDTVYHPNAKGRKARTLLVAESLAPFMSSKAAVLGAR